MAGETEEKVSAWTTDTLRLHILALLSEALTLPHSGDDEAAGRATRALKLLLRSRRDSLGSWLVILLKLFESIQRQVHLVFSAVYRAEKAEPSGPQQAPVATTARANIEIDLASLTDEQLRAMHMVQEILDKAAGLPPTPRPPWD